jgi:hypothetical protein
MKKTLIFFSAALLFVANGFAQNAPINIAIGSADMLTSVYWSGNFVSNPGSTTAGSPYEGATHILFDYDIPAGDWWGGGEFALNPQDWSNHTHLKLAWKSTSADPTVKFFFYLTGKLGSANKIGTEVEICSSGNSPAYQEILIPLSDFASDSITLSHIESIVFRVQPGAANGSAVGQFYLDAIQVLDYLNLNDGPVKVYDYDTLDMGSVNVGSSPSVKTMTFQNLTPGLTLTIAAGSTVSVSGADPSDFTIDQSTVPSTLGPGSSTTFTITFNPGSFGDKYATINIANSFSAYESYQFTVKGQGITPEIDVIEGSTNIASPGTYDFGSTNVGVSTSAITFTIENNGNGDLNLIGIPDHLIAISGAHAADFAIDETSTSSTVTAGNSTSFTIIFTPSSEGAQSAVITIANDDTDEGSYIINLIGTGSTPSGLFGKVNSVNSFNAAVKPNPSNGIYSITTDEKIDEIIVTDFLGNIISQSSNMQVDLSNQSNGVYFLTIISGDKKSVEKLVKQ